MTDHRSRRALVVSLAVAAALAVTLFAVESQAEMKSPKMTTLSGKVIDLTCASKGKAMMDSWYNAENDEHMKPGGKKAANCAKMCLLGGQPAALFDGNKITAVFSCNPRATLANYAAQDVEVQGFWGGSKKDAARSFVPQKIRATGSGDWEDVDCATMHN